MCSRTCLVCPLGSARMEPIGGSSLLAPVSDASHSTDHGRIGLCPLAPNGRNVDLMDHPQSETLAYSTWATLGVAHRHVDTPAQSRDPAAFDSFLEGLIVGWLLPRILRHLFQPSIFTPGADRLHLVPSHESAHASGREPIPHAARYPRPVAGKDEDAPE